MKMIRIEFVLDTIDTPTGGTEKQLVELIRRIDRSRFDLELAVHYQSEYLLREFKECPVHVVGFRSFKSIRSWLNIFRLARHLRKRKPDIVHTYFQDGYVVGILSARLAGVRKIVAGRRNQGYWMDQYPHSLYRCIKRWVDLFVTNSESTKRWVSDAEGVDPSRIMVIHNGVEISAFDGRDQESMTHIRDRYGIPSGAPVVGIVANLRPVKRIDVFLQAAMLVADKKPEVRFLVVGHDGQGGELLVLADRLGIADKVIFTGRIMDVAPVIRIFDIGVLSSDSESFSNSVVEYLAAGLPVVTTDVGGAREAVEDGVNGYVVPVGDHRSMADRILEVLAGGRMQEMGVASRQRAEMFRMEAMVRKHEDLYAQLAGA
jgi:glycosyltransferase involved in cell wall biosynthesis